MKLASAIASSALALAACASSRPAERTASSDQAAAEHAARPAPPRSGAMSMENCPMAVPGTSVAAQDTPEGEAITFSTSSGDVNELRRRVRTMSEMHDGHHMGGDTASMGQGAGGSAMGSDVHESMTAPTSRATVSDVEGGARVDIVPVDPTQVEQVRAAARTHAEHMQREGCAMGE